MVKFISSEEMLKMMLQIGVVIQVFCLYSLNLKKKIICIKILFADSGRLCRCQLVSLVRENHYENGGLEK